MMKRIFLKRALSLLMWSHPVLASAGIDVTLTEVPQAIAPALLEETATYDQWIKAYGLPSSGPKIEVQIVLPWQVSGRGGQTTGSLIQLNTKISKEHIRQIYRHELAHVFLNTYLDEKHRESSLVQETFALLLSGDDERIRRESKAFPTAASAYQFIRKYEHPTSKNLDAFIAAISRLLIEQSVRNKVESALHDLISKTEKEGVKRLLTALGHDTAHPTKKQITALVMDKKTGEILFSSGNITKPYPVASVLKPLILRLYPQMFQPQSVQNDPNWACPDTDASKIRSEMTWQSALQLSCNGFFLTADQKDLDWTLWSKHLSRFGISNNRARVSSAQEAIGLVPSVKLSLSEVAAIYREIVAIQPEIINALGGTVEQGTLSESPEAPFFKMHSAKLKTGTLRTIQSEPVAGWVAGQIKDTIVVVHGEGFSGPLLLPHLKTMIEPWLDTSLKPVAVQVMGLVPETAIRFSCAQGPVHYSKHQAKSVSAKDLRVSDTVTCLHGGIIAEFPMRDRKKHKRTYWGAITYAPTKAIVQEDNVRIKQARARAGSSFVLETTERSYVARVLASEMSHGRKETLKALAFVVRQNLYSGRHHDRPLCDTTHCQVYGTADTLTASQLKPFTEAYDAIAHLPMTKGVFLNFSKGGNDAWTTTRSISHVLENTQSFASKIDIKKIGNEIVVNSQKFSCERFRNLLALNSCPNEIRVVKEAIEFSGKGEGHGLGMDLIKADTLAAQGQSYESILKAFY